MSQPQLKIESGPLAGKLVAVRPGLVMGRGDDCGLTLPDGHCSRHHARIDQVPDGWVLVDLESTNGCSVNGKRVKYGAPVCANDRLMVGHTLMTFLAETPAAPAVATPITTPVAPPVPSPEARPGSGRARMPSTQAGRPASNRSKAATASDRHTVPTGSGPAATAVFLALLAVIYFLSAQIVRLALGLVG